MDISKQSGLCRSCAHTQESRIPDRQLCRREYGRFRFKLMGRILSEKLTPRQVSTILSENVSEFPEIQNSELRYLYLAGDIWPVPGGVALEPAVEAAVGEF